MSLDGQLGPRVSESEIDYSRPPHERIERPFARRPKSAPEGSAEAIVKNIENMITAAGGPGPIFDPVNKPAHYNQGKIEVADFIIDQKMSYLEGNIVKYVARYKHKNGLEDLKKAAWYLNKLISQVEKG